MTRANRIIEGLEKSLRCNLAEAQCAGLAAVNMLQIDSPDTPNFFEVLVHHTAKMHENALRASALHKALKKVYKDAE